MTPALFLRRCSRDAMTPISRAALLWPLLLVACGQDPVRFPQHCYDNAQNMDETDLNCGGSTCTPCLVDRTCDTTRDCAGSLSCVQRVCAVPSCSDGVKNGRESDVDCGGSCATCAHGKSCAAAIDCAAGVCTDGLCLAATCGDAIKNGDETDTDCGGGCLPCAPGKRCTVAAGCGSLVCTNGICQAATCVDAVKN